MPRRWGEVLVLTHPICGPDRKRLAHTHMYLCMCVCVFVPVCVPAHAHDCIRSANRKCTSPECSLIRQTHALASYEHTPSAFILMVSANVSCCRLTSEGMSMATSLKSTHPKRTLCICCSAKKHSDKYSCTHPVLGRENHGTDTKSWHAELSSKIAASKP